MRLILAATAALLVSTAAYAGDDIMANYYGNTVVGKSQMGESHTQYKADHTFTSALSSPMGSMDAKGTWAVNAKNELCRTYESAPPGMPNPVCVPWASHKVGDSWQITYNGRTTDISLVAGVQ